MWKKLSNKKKAHYLVYAFFVVLLLVYVLSFKKTIAEYSTCSKLEQQLKGLEYAPVKIGEYEQKIKYIEATIGANSSVGELYQELLLTLISGYCKKNGLTLNEFPEPHHFQQKNLVIETYPVVIKGSFVPMLKLLHHIELNKSYGRVVSARFVKKKDNETQKMHLFMTLYIQHVKKEQS